MRLKRILGGLGVIALAAVGTQLVAVQASSAHTPSASITCTAWSISATNYEALQHNTYSYSIDGGAATTGTFAKAFSKSGTFAAGSGDHTLVGYVYQNGDPAATYSKTYDLKTSACAFDKDVTLCHATDSNTNPYVEITVSAAGAYDGHMGHTGPVWNPTLKAQHIKWGDIIPTFTYNGHEYSMNMPAGQALLDNGCAAAPTAVSAAAATFTDGSCSLDPSYVVPTEPAGVLTTVTGADTTPLWNKTVTVTFTADEGYTLTGQAVYSHTFGAQPDCRTFVIPVNPAVTQATCDYAGQLSGFLITPVTTEGIDYTVDGLVVTATATSGNKLGSLPAGWAFAPGSDTVATFTVVPDVGPTCLIDSTSTAPTFSDDVCKADSSTGSSVTLPSSTGVNYRIDGVLTAAGTYAAVDGSKVTVTAEAQDNYNLTGVVSWTHTFKTAPTCSEVGGVHVTRPSAHVPAPHAVAVATTPLASTGVPTMSLLLIGGLLGLIGGGLCLATIRWGVRA